MGIRSFLEDAFRTKILPLNNKYKGMPISDQKDDLTSKQIKEGEYGASILDAQAISKFRTLSSNREERYTQFEALLKDATISAAIEMYADDSTQYDYRTGKIIWAESDDPNVAKAANRLIEVLQINQKAWQHIYALVAYGDVYLRLYRQGDKSDYSEMYGDKPTASTTIRIKVEDEVRPLDEYVEYVDDPATMYDLQQRDKTCGFIRMINQELQTDSDVINPFITQSLDVSDVNMYDRRAFVHISLTGNIDRHPELISLTDGKGNTEVYKVKTGKSILADAYEASQTVKLLEDSMMLSRLTKSALVRILQIEVGSMPKPEIEALLRRTKNLIEQKMAFNTANGTIASYNSPGPMENIIYVPTHDGKGSITSNNLGGDVNIKDIVDLDYFNNKKLSALKIPKQFLNYDAPEGLGNGTSLTKLSSRYAHTIMRVQNAYIAGITNLINLFFIDKCDIVKKKKKNLNDLRTEKEEDKNFIDFSNYINNFTIKMVSPATIEDTERDEQVSTRLDQANQILDLIEGKVGDEGSLEVVKWLLAEFLHLADISDILKNYPATHDEDFVQDNDDDFGGGSHHSFGGGSIGEPSGGFDDFGSEDTGSEDFGEGPEEVSVETNTDLNTPAMTPES